LFLNTNSKRTFEFPLIITKFGKTIVQTITAGQEVLIILRARVQEDGLDILMYHGNVIISLKLTYFICLCSIFLSILAWVPEVAWNILLWSHIADELNWQDIHLLPGIITDINLGSQAMILVKPSLPPTMSNYTSQWIKEC
jgi:hypothetical protein